MKKLVICTAIVLCFAARTAMAECTLSSSYSFPLTYTQSPRDITTTSVASSNEIGITGRQWSLSQIAALFGIGQNDSLVECDGGESLIIDNPDLSLKNNKLMTNVDDVYALVYVNGILKLPFNGAAESVLLTSSTGVYSLSDIINTTNSGLSFYLFYAGYVRINGVVDASIFFRIRTSDGKVLMLVRFDSFRVQVGSCMVNSYNSSVNFNELAVQKLNDTGTTSEEKMFNINVTCGEGLMPAITFTGNTDSEYTSVFTNQDGEGYAGGVGVQLLRANAIVTPGEEVSLGEPSSVTAIDYEFSSRVFSLSQSTTEGAIDIPVTFTLTYQ